MRIKKYKKIKLKLKSNFRYLLFTIFKYIEYAILALLYFLIARKVGPEEYGEATSSFLAISYSSFAILGVNQVLIKWHAIHEKEDIKKFFIEFNLLYNIIICIIVFFVLSTFLENEYKIYVAGIASLKLLQELLVNINRAKQHIFEINTMYLSFALCFCSLFFLFVTDIFSFFKFWLVGLLFSVTLGCILTLPNSQLYSNPKFFFEKTRIYFKRFIQDGIKLALIAAILPLYLNLDRILLINFTSIDKSYIGNLQLADNIATVVSFGISSLLFITTPIIIEKLKKGEIQSSYLFKISYRLLFVFLLGLTICAFPLIYLMDIVFPQYNQIKIPLILYLIGRLLYISLYVPKILSITFSRETYYIKVIYFWFAILLLLFATSIFFVDSKQLIWLLPIILIGIMICVHVTFFLNRKSSLSSKLGLETD